MDHSATVQDIYTAFGQGDIPAVLDRLAEDVAWEQGDHGHGVPWLEPRRGRQDAAGFFEALSALKIERFEPVALLANDHQVAAIIETEETVLATGRAIRDTQVHLWTFDEAGRVTAFRQFLDTHKNVEAYRG